MMRVRVIQVTHETNGNGFEFCLLADTKILDTWAPTVKFDKMEWVLKKTLDFTVD
jgi:hypothetical protein